MKAKLVVCLSLILVSCKPATRGETNVNISTAKLVQSPKHMRVAPVAAVAAALSIASSLKSLFGKSNDNSKQILQKLDQIEAQNAQIIETLGEVVSILQNMGVTIRENVRLETVFNRQAAIDGKALELYESWRAGLNDRRAQAVALDRYKKDVLPEVRTEARALMDTGFGYTPINSVGRAMFMELWMERQLHLPKATIHSDALTYATYFGSGLDASIANSPAGQLADASLQAGRLDKILAAADAQISAGFAVEVWHGWKNDRPHGRCTSSDEVSRVERATGDRQSGYSVEVTERVIRTTQSCGNDDGCKRCRMAVRSIDPSEPGGSQPSSRVPYWNDVLKTYQEAIAKRVLLKPVVDTVRIFFEEAKLASTS